MSDFSISRVSKSTTVFTLVCYGSVGFCRGSRVEGRGSRVEGRGSRVEGRGSRVEGRGSRVEGRGSRVEGRGSRVEGRGSRVEGRGSRVEGHIFKEVNIKNISNCGLKKSPRPSLHAYLDFERNFVLPKSIDKSSLTNQNPFPLEQEYFKKWPPRSPVC